MGNFFYPYEPKNVNCDPWTETCGTLSLKLCREKHWEFIFRTVSQQLGNYESPEFYLLKRSYGCWYQMKLWTCETGSGCVTKCNDSKFWSSVSKLLLKCTNQNHICQTSLAPSCVNDFFSLYFGTAININLCPCDTDYKTELWIKLLIWWCFHRSVFMKLLSDHILNSTNNCGHPSNF